MASDNWKKAEELFHDVIALPPEERPGRLAGADEALRAEVLSLVQAFEVASVQKPPRPASTPETASEWVGPYRLERELGEGGMGTVYLASRADQQFDKKVAIKVIRGGPGSQALIERFYRERQILAGMEHPNIARLIDGGLLPDGRPYLVMDYVEGTRLDKHCDAEKLGIRARLEIFLKVCDAVNYAHRSLVIHRDLKPNNILVTAQGEPKLLDFGIATAMRSAADGVDLTMTSGLFLTPLYASPEMIQGARVSVSSDVYSLGVILYELLCGRSPYEPHTLSPAFLIHAITTADPNFPSSPGAPSEPGNRSPEELAALRGETPASLAAKLRGELDSIVLKALAKSTEERYASVEQLADDLGRHLSGEPVLAIRAGNWYRARKFLKRHRGAVAAAAAFVVLLLGGVASTTWQARLAERRFNETRQLAKYLLFDLYNSVQKLPGSTPVQAQIAQESLGYLDRLSASRSGDRDLQHELAEGYLRAGNVLGNPFAPNLGKRDEAAASYRKALTLVEPLLPERRAALTHARVRLQLGGLLTFAAQTEREGKGMTRQAVQQLDQLLRATPDEEELRVEVGSAHQMLARQLSQSGGWVSNEAAPEVREHLERARELFLAGKQDARMLKHLALNHNIRALMLSSKDPSASLAEYTKALGYLDQVGPEQTDTEIRRLRASCLLNRGWDQGQLSDFDPAIRDIEAGKEIIVSIANADPQNMAAAYHCTNAFRNLGIVNNYAGRKEAALASFRQAVAYFDKLIVGEPLNTHHPLHRAEALIRISDLLVQLGRGAEAVGPAKEGLGYLTKLADSPSATGSQLLDATRWLLNTEVKALRDPQRALRYVQRTDAKTAGRDEYLAEALYSTGDAAGAVAAIDRMIAALPPMAPGEKPSRNRQIFTESRQRYAAGLTSSKTRPPQ
jgi:eukaryotic-like serine/threonine-protein kinase